jgi:F420-0:gamma-glutamyl ligase
MYLFLFNGNRALSELCNWLCRGRAIQRLQGKKDLFRQVFRVKNVAVVDELAASAELLMGQGREVGQVVIFRGLADAVAGDENVSIQELCVAVEGLFESAL